MVDLKDVRENPDRYRNAAKVKRISADIDGLLQLDASFRSLQLKREQLTAEKNQIGKQIGQIAGQLKKASPEQKAQLEEQMKKLQARPAELKAEEQRIEPELAELEKKIQEILLCVPQPPDADVPQGKDDTENVEVRRWGEVKQFDFRAEGS